MVKEAQLPAFFFRIKLKEAHDATGLTAYMVGKQAGVAVATVEKYAAGNVEQLRIPVAVATLCDFYGVDLFDVVEIVKVDNPPEPLAPLIPLMSSVN